MGRSKFKAKWTYKKKILEPVCERGGGKSSAAVFCRNGPFTGVALGHRPHTSVGSNSSLTSHLKEAALPQYLNIYSYHLTSPCPYVCLIPKLLNGGESNSM